MTSVWRNVSVNVVAKSNWSCLLISDPNVHWRVQPPATRRSGRFNKMHGAQCALHVSLDNASTRTVRKCLKRNIGQLVTLQICMEWRYRRPIWGATHETTLWGKKTAPCSFMFVKFSKYHYCLRNSSPDGPSPSDALIIQCWVLEGSTWNLIQCSRDITNTQFVRHSQWDKFRRFHWTLRCWKAFSFRVFAPDPLTRGCAPGPRCMWLHPRPPLQARALLWTKYLKLRPVTRYRILQPSSEAEKQFLSIDAMFEGKFSKVCRV